MLAVAYEVYPQTHILATGYAKGVVDVYGVGMELQFDASVARHHGLTVFLDEVLVEGSVVHMLEVGFELLDSVLAMSDKDVVDIFGKVAIGHIYSCLFLIAFEGSVEVEGGRLEVVAMLFVEPVLVE